MTWRIDGTKKVARHRYPAGYAADGDRPDVFDPALRHYRNGFVKGEPEDAAKSRALNIARSRLLQDCLVALARSPVRDLLVLRGGLTMLAWFPDRARHPRDIDFVVRDPSCDPDSRAAASLLLEIRRAVCAGLVAGGAQPIEDAIALDGIWTYERAEGRRITVPWSRADVRGEVQVDAVFREPLLDAPDLEPVGGMVESATYREPGVRARLWFASRAESLAWKLLWLDCDSFPQGKDLYDAVLLAEDAPPSFSLVQRVFEAKGEKLGYDAGTGAFRRWEVEWAPFEHAYPQLATGGVDAWIERLRTAVYGGFSR